MMPNIVRGDRMTGLMQYLVGPGRSNEHTHPQIVAGDDRVLFEFDRFAELDSADASRMGAILDEPRVLHGTRVTRPVKEFDEESQRYVKTGEKDAHVWHCSLSLRADDRPVVAETWGKIATDFVEKMGFVDPDGAQSSRWVAVHHGTSKAGNDHIHIAVQLVREDGTKAKLHMDYKRAQQACAELEKKYGLTVVESRGKSRGLSGDRPAEIAKAQRLERSYTDRSELRRRMRTALVGSESPREYLVKLREMNVRVAPSFRQGSTTHVRGYKVAIPGKTGDGLVWYAPSKLDATLGWPNVQARFGQQGTMDAERYLAALHNSAATSREDQVRVPKFADKHLDRLMSGKTGTGPDTLANIYARMSMQLEGTNPGKFAQLSDTYARAAQGRGNASHAVRLNHRFSSQDATRGWLAVLQQANRVSRMMNSQKLGPGRPQLAATATGLIRHATMIAQQAESTSTRPVSGVARGVGGPSRTRTTEYNQER